jgi:hypothetical protein
MIVQTFQTTSNNTQIPLYIDILFMTSIQVIRDLASRSPALPHFQLEPAQAALI